jgi:hypothetical protein
MIMCVLNYDSLQDTETDFEDTTENQSEESTSRCWSKMIWILILLTLTGGLLIPFSKNVLCLLSRINHQ